MQTYRLLKRKSASQLWKTKKLPKARLIKQAARACHRFEKATSDVVSRFFEKKKKKRAGFEQSLVATSDVVNRIFQKEKLRSVLDCKTDVQKQKWAKAMGCLLQLGSSSEGNNVEIYKRGDEYFKALWHGFRNAEKEILFECYILKNDEVSSRTLWELSGAARRGVKVTAIFDWVGASELPSVFTDDLKSAGARVLFYNPPELKKIFNPRTILFRNHKKATVIDQKIAFVGGMNATNEYCTSEIRGGIDRFRDTHARLCGPAVDDIRQNFLDSLTDLHPEGCNEDLNEELEIPTIRDSLCKKLHRIPRRVIVDTGSKTKEHIDNFKSKIQKIKTIGQQVPAHIRNLTCDRVGFANGTMVQVLQSFRNPGGRNIQTALHHAICTSKEAISITNPYFLPPPQFRTDILDAAKRGVEVKIITCRQSDVPIMAYAARHLYQDFLGDGVRIFEYKKKVLHSKTMVIDDVFSTFGSFNFDDWSYRRNLELNIVMMDPEKAQELKGHFEEDLEDSEEVTLDYCHSRGWHSRIWYWSAYQAARLPKRFEGVRSGPDAGLSPYSMTYPKLYNNSKSEVVI